jgi:hypothetical protein
MVVTVLVERWKGGGGRHCCTWCRCFCNQIQSSAIRERD